MAVATSERNWVAPMNVPTTTTTATYTIVMNAPRIP